MTAALGLEKRDARNLIVVAVVVAAIVAALTEGPLEVRLVGGVGAGVISAVTFLVVTVLIHRIKPDGW